MTDLREKIAEIVREACQTKNRQFAYVEFSDAILSLPELREARPDKQVDRLVKFATMMVGELKSARDANEAAARFMKVETGAELMMHHQHRSRISTIIQMGEQALEPFRSELEALDPH